MSLDAQPSTLGRLLGLVLVAGLIWLLAILWSSGPTVLRGTVFQDLTVIAYVVAAFGLLTLAERVFSAWTRR